MANNEKGKPSKVKAFFVRIGKFFKDVFGELKKVTWPTRKELVSYTLTVLAFVAVMAIIVGVLDFLFGNGVALLAKL